VHLLTGTAITIILATATTRATTATAGEATIGLAIMAGGTATGGAADTAGTAADGTVIIDSELGHGARRRSPQRGTFVRRWLPVNDAASYAERLWDALFLRQLVKCGEATCACRLQ
jgi:hypothetical protein